MFLVVTLAAAMLIAVASGAKPALAAGVTFSVTTVNDEVLTNSADTNCVSASGCSLRAALQAADNRGADMTAINLPAGTYGLSPTFGALRVGAVSGEVVSITGTGSPIVRQNFSCTEDVFRRCMVFFLDPSGNGGITVSLSGLSIQGGHTSDPGGGGGVLGGSLKATPDSTSISNCVLTGNSTSGGAPGGGIAYAHGSLMVSNSTFDTNHAGGGSGGGIDFADTIGGSSLTVSNSSFSHNATTATLNGGGGAIHMLGVGSTYSVTRSLFDGNTAFNAPAPGGGGAILKDSGTLTLTGNTFTGNSAGGSSVTAAGGAVNSSSDDSNLGDGTTPGLNRFAANTASFGKGLFRNTGNAGVVTAENNWWGTNAPNTSNASANVSLTNWIVLGLTANPAFLGRGESASLTADLSHNNVSASPGLVPTGPPAIPVAWPSATLGTLSGQTLVLDTSAQATATYTAGSVSGTGTASVQVDGQTVTANIPILFAPTITKSFGGATVALGATTPLTFNLGNPNSVSALSGVGFDDTLPAGLEVATPNGLIGSCGAGAISAVAGSSSIGLSGGTIAASGSCSFSVDVKGTLAGTKNNATGNVTSTEAGTGDTASATTDVVAPPSIAKSFSPGTIALNDSTSLSFTITNPGANDVALTGVSFTDTLPAGLTVADSSSSVCGGTVTTVAATSIISLSGASVATASTCNFAVAVIGAASGDYTNTTGAVTSTNGGTGNTATDSLVVAGPPTIGKWFAAATVPLGGTTTLNFKIKNLNATITLTGVGFTDNLPAGLVVATPNGLSGSCGGGIITATAGGSSVSLSAATLAAGTNCHFSVKVTGTAAGTKHNKTDAVTSNEGGLGGMASARIVVVAPPSLRKHFGAHHIAIHTTTSLSFVITNPTVNRVSLTGVGFRDTLPAGLVVATPNGLSGSCDGGTIVAVAGTRTIKLTGATLAPHSSCTFSVTVEGTAIGIWTNTTGAVKSTNGGAGNNASAQLRVTRL